MQKLMIEAMERRILPDRFIRLGIRKLCYERLQELERQARDTKKLAESRYANDLKKMPIAVHAEAANQQHYELPPEFFRFVLGKNLKYSSAFWGNGCSGLDEAEEAALQTTLQRAELRDGMKILELGCGWGSLTLAMAKAYPNAKIVALSNSNPQRSYIESEIKRLNLKNVQIITQNIAAEVHFKTESLPFDRVVSVEMFEHLKNYEQILKKISHWLSPEGKLFVHIFTHKESSYPFEVEGESNWMGKYFFTGGQMPSRSLFSHFQNDLKIESQWEWDGTHYGKTAEAWLKNMDAHVGQIRVLFDQTYGVKESARWFQRWRVFFMSCAELFNYRRGSEWGVSHYLFQKR